MVFLLFPAWYPIFLFTKNGFIFTFRSQSTRQALKKGAFFPRISKRTCILWRTVVLFLLIWNGYEWAAPGGNSHTAKTGWCEPSWGCGRAFSQELPPEQISRVCRVTPLWVLDVSCIRRARRFRRIAGGTAEGQCLRPDCGTEGLSFLYANCLISMERRSENERTIGSRFKQQCCGGPAAGR